MNIRIGLNRTAHMVGIGGAKALSKQWGSCKNPTLLRSNVSFHKNKITGEIIPFIGN